LSDSVFVRDDHIAEFITHFAEALGLSRYSLYMQDYVGPVGFRMILTHPERVESLIVQDAVAHNTGLGANWKTRRAFWADRAAHESALRENLLSLQTTRTRHAGNDPNGTLQPGPLDRRVLLSQPTRSAGNSNRSFLRLPHQCRELSQVAGVDEGEAAAPIGHLGPYESSFDPSEPESYRRDVPSAQVHIVDGGHFALDTAADHLAVLVRTFLEQAR
jgi:pimeloyl-ACP methyl ester carboxylesterase